MQLLARVSGRLAKPVDQNGPLRGYKGEADNAARDESMKACPLSTVLRKVAALTEERESMFVIKIKCVPAVVLVAALAVTGAAAVGQQGASERKVEVKADSEAQKLVQQLGSQAFAEREAADKALAGMGARGAAAVRVGMNDTDLEIARRCAALWPRLWQTEIARTDADRLASYAHPLWVRFRNVAGDDPGSRTLFAEMVADLDRFRRLEAVEADLEKAGAAYTAELKQRAEALERGTQEAIAAAGRRTGPIVPSSGRPTRGEFITLLFLGTYPGSAKDEGAANTHHNIFAFGIGPTNREDARSIRPALRRLYAAWLGTRTDPRPIAIGMNLALYNGFAEVAPVAVAFAANDKLAPSARGFALLAVGRFGTPADLPLLERAFADSRVFHTTKYTFNDGKQRGVEVRVSDTAVAAALRLSGRDAADFGFTFQEMYKRRGPEALAEHYLLGFFQEDDAARQAAHKKAREWLDEHRKEKP
jgi:hypothetical protein